MTGVLVPPNNSEALAYAIIGLLDNDSQRLSMGRSARQKAVAQYSIDKILAQTLAYYHRVLERVC